jgi:hypothetical protein
MPQVQPVPHQQQAEEATLVGEAVVVEVAVEVEEAEEVTQQDRLQMQQLLILFSRGRYHGSRYPPQERDPCCDERS